MTAEDVTIPGASPGHSGKEGDKGDRHLLNVGWGGNSLSFAQVRLIRIEENGDGPPCPQRDDRSDRGADLPHDQSEHFAEEACRRGQSWVQAPGNPLTVAS